MNDKNSTRVRLDEFTIGRGQAEPIQNWAAWIDGRRDLLRGVMGQNGGISQAWFISPDEKKVYCLSESKSHSFGPGELIMNNGWNAPNASREIETDYYLLNRGAPERQIQLVRTPIKPGMEHLWCETVTRVNQQLKSGMERLWCEVVEQRNRMLATMQGVVLEASFSTWNERFLALSAKDLNEASLVFEESLKTGEYSIDRQLMNAFRSCLDLQKSKKMRPLLHVTSRPA